MLGRKWFRLIMRWPHFPGEDLAPDICPLTEPVLPRFRFDEPITAVTIHRMKTFVDVEGMTVIEDANLGRIPLEES